MRVALYSPYLDTLGGGERYLATIAEGLAPKNQVDFFWDDQNIVRKLESRFNLDLSNVGTVYDVFKKRVSLIKKIVMLRNYDLVIYLSDGSIPTPLSRKNVLHFQVPFILKDGRRISNKLKLARYDAVICNSIFTKKYIDETYGVVSRVIYPPVDFSYFRPRGGIGRKENLIVSVGRFSSIFGGKKQDVLIDVFRDFHKDYPQWSLIIAGGSSDEKYVKNLVAKAEDLPIKILTNISAENLKELYVRASIYWHATGYSEDLERYPERAEHFGISVVEAMAASCVPVVFEGGGLTEIVDNTKNGFLWEDKDGLLLRTKKLANDRKLREKLAGHAKAKARNFSKERFTEEFTKILK